MQRSALGAWRVATLAIEDVDSTFTWGFSWPAVEYGGSVLIYVERRGVMSLPATVDYATLPGTATPGEDYVAVTSTLEFLRGQAYAWFTFEVLNDGLVEGPETFLLHLSRPTGGAVLGAESNAVITIEDNDGGMAFTETNLVFSENSASVTLAVARYDDGLAPLTVDYFTSDDTARAGVNYVARSGTLSLPTPLGSNTVTIPLLDECLLKSERAFTVSLRNPSSGGALGSNLVAVVTIEGNDRPGKRDLSFSRLPLPNYHIGDVVVRVLPNGKILGATRGYYEHNGQSLPGVFQLNADGSVDPSFQFFSCLLGCGAHAVEVQRDGRILVRSFRGITAGGGWFDFVRLWPWGTFDASFQAPEDFFGLGPLHLGQLPSEHAVSCVLAQPDGRILVGGRLYALTRLLADGSPDADFRTRARTEERSDLAGVQSLALQPDGRILVGGLFTALGGVARHGLLRLESNGQLDFSFDPGGGPTNEAGPSVGAVCLQQDGKILIAGGFTHCNGVPCEGVARLWPDGTLDGAFDPGAIRGGSVRALVLQPNGRIVLGGSFTSVQGIQRSGLARLNPDGALDLTFDPAPDQYDVLALALQSDGRLVLSSIAPRGTPGLWRVNGDLTLRFREMILQPDGNLRLRLNSLPRRTYALEISANLVDWLPLQTKLAADCVLEFTVPAGPEANRFYRAVQIIP